MKVRASVKRLCEFCYTVRRRGKLFVYCKKTPRHKQRQWFATEAEGGSTGGSECVSCAAPLAPSAPSFALEAAAASSSSSPALYASLSGLLMGGRTAGAGGAGFGGAAGGFTLGEVHRQAAMLLGGGGRR